MQVSKDGIEAIKTANPLADVVAERGISLQKKGRAMVGRCPFHEDKTPSLTITPSKGLFHCFGCGVAGDVIGFVTRYDKTSFTEALGALSRRAGLDLEKLMEPRPRNLRKTPLEVLTPPRSEGKVEAAPPKGPPPAAVLSRVVDHYHEAFCRHEEAQAFMRDRGITDPALLKALEVGYADGSLLKRVGKEGKAREQLQRLGVITDRGRELLGGCIVVPIPDPLSGQWTSLYGRGRRSKRHCYLPGPLRGVVNFQAARLASEVILTESILDAMSFHQAGISTAIPIYGTHGFTSDHLDLFKREGVSRVVLALDNDEAGRRATASLGKTLARAGLDVGVASFPKGIKDANALLLSRNGDAQEAFRQVLEAAEAKPETPPSEPSSSPPSSSPLSEEPTHEDGEIVMKKGGLTYRARPYPVMLGRLRTTVKVENAEAFHVDTLDLYASRSRVEFAKRASRAVGTETDAVETALLALVVEAEKAVQEPEEGPAEAEAPPAMSDAERRKALGVLKRPDLLDQLARDIDTLGYVGEETNKRLLYLVAVSRKLPDPLSAIVLSQSGAGKSGLTETIERLCPPEDVVLLTRLTPQSLYYVEADFLDHKLVIVEERYGSMEADYSIRVLQSRKKLIAAAPVKDPQTGNMRTKVFTVEARAAFIEATTASRVNQENATRCFELSMDEGVEQTQRIHERQRVMKTERGLRLREEAEQVARLHWNAQRLLEPAPVVIPFADKLTFPTSWMRTRRDHARFLNLIEVSAFLHQHQRERRRGAICAAVADYAVAYELSRDVLAETLADVRRPLRDAFRRIQELSLNRDGTVSRRQIRETLNVPDSTVRRWLAELVELECLEPDGKVSQGRSVRYRVKEELPEREQSSGLLSPAELRARAQ